MRRRICILTPILTAVLLLSGCMLGPDYHRPPQPLPDRYYEPAVDSATIANLAWWELFNDPILSDLITQSIEHNRNLAEAAARIEQARAILAFTRADQFPRLDLSGNALRTRTSENAFSPGTGTFNDFGLFGDLSFEIDIWGRLRRATEADRAALLASEYGHRAVLISLISQVAATYFRILGLEHRLNIARGTSINRERNTRLNRSRFAKGIVPELDVNQAEIEEADARAISFDLERDLRQTEHALSVLLGEPPGPIARGRDLYRQELRSELPAGLPLALLEQRPDVRAAEETLHSEVARIGIRTAERLPTVDLLGFIGLQSERTADLFEGRSRSWRIGGSLFGPLIDFGKSRAAQRAQEAEARAALASYEQTVLQAVQEVEDALVAIRTAKAGFEQRELQTGAARNAARLSHARYDEGVTSYLEVLDIERSLFDAELSASSNRELYLISIVQLYKALGGGWDGIVKEDG